MSVQHDPALARPFRTSMVSIKIGERVYPAVRNNRCKVCTHPARPLIEEKLLLNETYPAVVAFVQDRESQDIDGIMVPWPNLTVSQLTNHFRNGHCPIDTKVMHDLTEQMMTEMGTSYEDSLPRIINPLLFSKLVLNRGQERLVKGEIEPTVRETLAAAKLIHDIEIDSTQADLDRMQAYVQAMGVYLDTVQKIVTDEQWAEIAASFATNPVLREIESRLAVIDAEVIDE